MTVAKARDRRATPHGQRACALEMRDEWRAFDRCAAPMFVLDRAGHVVAWNEACARSTGHTKAEVIGRRLWRLRFVYAQEWQHAWQTGNIPADIELRVSRPDGVSNALGWILDVRRAQDGSLVDVLATCANLESASSLEFDEHRHYEEVLRAHERLLTTMIEVLPVAVTVCDARGQIVSANKAARRLWGGARYVGVADYGLYKGWWVDTGKSIAAEEWALARAVRKGETSVGELIRIQTFDGRVKTILNSATPLRDDSGAIVGAIAGKQDVSSLRDAEERLSLALRAQREMQRIVSHDLCSPLSGILLTVAALLRSSHAELSPATVDALRVIERAGTRMHRLLADLLDAARIEGGVLIVERAAQPLCPPLEKAVALVQPLAAGRSIVLEAPATLPDVDVDLHRVLQVLDNLLGNAIKFTEPAGRIVVSGRPLDGRFVEVAVADDGCGIPEKNLPRVFEQFWQGDRSDVHGFGLGLAICKAIVEGHGGCITVTSAPGCGSTFRFTLPIARPSDDKKLNVLVVDDDPTAVELMAVRILGLTGTVKRAYGGREAIDAARQELPDLIVLDLMMPELDGFAVVEALQEHPDTARIPILVVTAKQITAEDRDRLKGYVTTIMDKTECDRDRFAAEVRRFMPDRPRVA